jgi:ubiquinone/menaquinone biosynthesis C-methylase UbiE
MSVVKRPSYPEYDDIPYIGRLKAVIEFVESIPLKGKVLLDVGSSIGLIEHKLQAKGLKKIIGIEPSKDAVKFAKKRLKKVEFYVSNASDLKVKDKSIDIVTMLDVIEHVPANSEPEALKEVSRVLKKGGKFLLTTPNRSLFVNLLDPAWYFGHRHYAPEDIKKLVEAQGMKVRKLKVRGSIWTSIYMVWFYIMKWVFRQSFPRNEWFERIEDKGYKKGKIETVFLMAEKI